MSNARPVPIFPVANVPERSVEENVKLLGTLCHVVEVKGAYALCHASPQGLARIATELSLPIFHSQRGGEYYAVRVAAKATLTLVPPPAQVARPPVAPLVLTPSPGGPASRIGQTNHLDIRGQEYQVTETRTKRRCDLRRWEVRKLDGSLSEPYVVTFQDADESACSCPDFIYRRRVCKHQAAIKAAFGRSTVRQILAG